jgi:four helix bundle protein
MDNGNATVRKPWGIADRSFAFSVAIVKLCQRLDSIPGVPRRLSGQLFDAGTSVGSNVREGQAAQTRHDFITKYSIALKESNETDYWLSLIVAANVLPLREVKDLLDEVRELSKILGRCIVTARRNDPKPKRVR